MAFNADAFKDPKKWQILFNKYTQNETFKFWGTITVVAFLVFMFFSSGDFSFLLTLSSLLSMFSFMMVALKIETGSSASGVSLKMMESYIIIFVSRLFAIIPFEGYLPFDKSGDWLYQLCEAMCLCLCGSIVYLLRGRYANTYNPDTDSFNHHWLMLAAACLAMIFHPNLNNFLPSDICWAFALYLESVAILCQLFMFHKEGKAAPHTSHFLAAQALAKLLSFIFWASSFSELSNPNHYIKAFVGNWVVAMQLIQLLVMGDFIYAYVRCVSKGISVSQVVVYSDNV